MKKIFFSIVRLEEQFKISVDISSTLEGHPVFQENFFSLPPFNHTSDVDHYRM